MAVELVEELLLIFAGEGPREEAVEPFAEERLPALLLFAGIDREEEDVVGNARLSAHGYGGA